MENPKIIRPLVGNVFVNEQTKETRLSLTEPIDNRLWYEVSFEMVFILQKEWNNGKDLYFKINF